MLCNFLRNVFPPFRLSFLWLFLLSASFGLPIAFFCFILISLYLISLCNLTLPKNHSLFSYTLPYLLFLIPFSIIFPDVLSLEFFLLVPFLWCFLFLWTLFSNFIHLYHHTHFISIFPESDWIKVYHIEFLIQPS